MTYSTGFMLYQQAAKSASNPAMMKMISGESVKYFRMTTEILPDFYGAQSFLGYSALLNGDSATAQVALEKAIEIWKAKSASKTGAKDSSMTFAYASLYDLYMNGNKQDKAKLLLAEGQSQFPDNKSLKILELNYYLQNGDFQNGIPAFEKAVKDNPTNEDIAIAYANMLEKKGDNDAALKVYQNVLSFSPNSFNANYNLGAMYVNKAAELSKKSNEEKDEKKIIAYQAQIKEQFNLSLPYMEKSHEVAPNDLSVIQALIQITTYLELNEASMKYITLKKKLASGGK
jgi:tetratricopeptide (TPR) repeat protein